MERARHDNVGDGGHMADGVNCPGPQERGSDSRQVLEASHHLASNEQSSGEGPEPPATAAPEEEWPGAFQSGQAVQLEYLLEALLIRTVDAK